MPKIRGLTKRKGETEWSYDFVIRGNRFLGKTGRSSRRDAEKALAEIRERAKAEVLKSAGPPAMSFAEASTRWWIERGQHRKDARNIEWTLAWLQAQIGKEKPIAAIDDNLVAALVARRRGEGVTPATVNRSMTEPLRAILTRANDVWRKPVGHIHWRQHKLKEPQQRVREASVEEETRLLAAIRPDFRPIIKFLLITGLRRGEACELRWADVNLDAGEITVCGKGDRIDMLPLPPAALAIISAEIGKHSTHVFSYTVRHPWGGQKGDRIPICGNTLGAAYWRARAKAGVYNLKLHDLRHTAATRFLRATGNMAGAQRMLRHQRITTTERYAHVTKEDLRAMMAAAFPAESPADVSETGANSIKSKGKSA